MTISELGTSCMNTLNDLVDKSSSSKEDGRHALVDDFRGRFRIWAANIGALRPESSPKSLDYRVREADDMKSSIMSGLGRIKESGTSAYDVFESNYFLGRFWGVWIVGAYESVIVTWVCDFIRQ
ncbi:hypothetical protein CKAH01_17944 [Colletotrichum kahawae]|uniref:Uncharacterized protein n=1 Tax=Colletotrichum kahawae TaxID=34407 RepID=A0AAD9Y9K9_COLKA|nr:hypothetical protein CKAH01_17944 [Colletotrichum kahawae]